MSNIDPNTGRPFGDHGTATQALDWALDHHEADQANQLEFLRAWREGAAWEEWPDFYEWLKQCECPTEAEGPLTIGRTELSGGSDA